MAGVTAATRLRDLGYKNIVILEASDRVGGRMKDVKLGNVTVEQGANYIQGLGKNPIYRKAKEYNLKFVKDGDSFAAYNRRGSDITRKMRRLDNEFYKVYKKTDKLARKVRANGELDASYRAGLVRSEWSPKTQYEDLIEIYYHDWEFTYSPDSSSLKESILTTFDIHESDDEAIVVDKRGFAYIAKRMLKESMAKGGIKILFNKRVTKIKQDERKVTIQTADDKQLIVDYVIVTVSVGVLQNRLVDFVPNLPDWKLDAIDQIQMGLYYSIFLRFPRQFWDDKLYILFATPRRGYYPIFHNKNQVISNSNILQLTVLGEEVRRVDRLPKTIVERQIMQVLTRMYGGAGRRIPQPLEINYNRWYSDPLFMGSYSNIPPGYTHERHMNLSRPVGRVYFGGEATVPDHFGYVHGAWYSGKQTADELNDFICKY